MGEANILLILEMQSLSISSSGRLTSSLEVPKRRKKAWLYFGKIIKLVY
jgi:hypothetical protein